MTRRRGRMFAPLGALLGTAVLLLVGTPVAAADTLGADRAADSIELVVNSVTPSAPQPTASAATLRVRLTLRNLSDNAVRGVRVSAQRGYPIGSQNELATSLAKSDSARPGTGSSTLPLPATHPIRVTVPGAGSVQVTFTTTTSVSLGHGLCLCANAVYPLYFSARNTAGDVLGSVRTYLPSFDTSHRRVQVTWLWPLIDRPHRLADRNEFLDDDLTGLVDGGRLDSALQVVERVAPSVPMTLVVDPELLDELEVMAHGHYTVLRSSGRLVRGTGARAARTWLGRLADVLDNSDVSIDLTPYGDPDVQALSRHGLSWRAGLPADMVANVRAALAGRSVQRDIAWPTSGALGAGTIGRLAETGTRIAVLRGAAVRPSTANGIPLGLSRLHTGHGPVTAALTSSTAEHLVASAISLGGTGVGTLPKLMADLAVRVDEAPGGRDVAVLTPPRYVYPNPDAAVRVIRDTSSSTFTRPVTVRAAARGSAVPHRAGRLRAVPASAETLPARILSRLIAIHDKMPDVRSLLGRNADSTRLVTGLSEAQQRVASSAFRRRTGVVDATGTGLLYSRRLLRQVGAILSGVHIVKPASGAYTLASNHSPLPITIQNTLGYEAAVRIDVSAVGGLPGFSATDDVQHIPADSREQIKVPTVLQRSGRIRVVAQLHTPNGAPIGRSYPLTVHSTALGEIGIVITVAAGVVLVAALLLRYIRRLQRLHRKRVAAAARRAPQLSSASPGTASRSSR